MVIIVKKWPKILRLWAKTLFLILFLLLIACGLKSFPKKVAVNHQEIAKEYWCQNPLYTERKVNTFFDEVVDQIVIKLQDYYYEERE